MDSIDSMRLGKSEFKSAKANSTCVVVGHTKGHIYNKENVDKAVKAMIDKHPKLRVNVDLKTNCWRYVTNPYIKPEIIQATSEEEWKNIFHQQMNERFTIGDDSSLFRFLIIQYEENAQIMINQDHCATDGMSGLILIDTFLDFYSQFENSEGEEIKSESLPWLPNADVLSFPSGLTEEEEEKILELKNLYEKKMKSWKVIIKTKLNPDPNDFRNNTIFKDGSEENLPKIRAKCKELKITIGTLITAACFFNIAKFSTIDWKESYTATNVCLGLAINLRDRLEEPLGKNHVGFFVGSPPLDFDLSVDTDFWDFCAEIQKNIQSIVQGKNALLITHARSCVNSADPEIVQNIKNNNGSQYNLILSNVGAYPFETAFKTKDGNVTLCKVNSGGAPWSPRFTCYGVMVHSVKFLSYSVNLDYFEGKGEIAQKVLEGITYLVENSHFIDKMSLGEFLGI